MNKSTIIAVLVLFLGICISSINAHTPWGACMTIYNDRNRQGAKHDVCHSGFLSSAFNKRVSSVSIPEGFNARLFKTSNYRGKFLDLQAGANNLPSDWDKQVSSIQFYNWGDGCGTIYSGPNRSGATFKVCSDASNLQEGYGGRFESVHVAPLHFFRLYKGNDFDGEWMDVRGSLSLRSDWANKVRSMKLQHWAECAWFFNEANRGGRMFQVCDSGTFPSQWSRQASSIVVPKKMTIIVYKGADYKGASRTFTAGTHNLPADWNNAIASVKVEIEGKMTGNS